MISVMKTWKIVLTLTVYRKKQQGIMVLWMEFTIGTQAKIHGLKMYPFTEESNLEYNH